MKYILNALLGITLALAAMTVNAVPMTYTFDGKITNLFDNDTSSTPLADAGLTIGSDVQYVLSIDFDRPGSYTLYDGRTILINSQYSFVEYLSGDAILDDSLGPFRGGGYTESLNYVYNGTGRGALSLALTTHP